MPRELLLMSPYTPPAQHALMLGSDDTACWLNAWCALWHPAALRVAAGPPRWIGPYDQNEPGENQLVAMPVAPPLYLAADWTERIRAKGGATFDATPDRAATLANLRVAIGELGDDLASFDDPDCCRRCHGLGLGYLVVETLFEAMERERTLDRDGFWADIQAGIETGSAGLAAFQAAAQKLLAARETLYPSAIHLLDLTLVDSAGIWSEALTRHIPVNLVASGQSLEATARSLTDLTAMLRSRFGEPRDPDSSESANIELCGGSYLERADDLLPLESQFWNLRRGRAAARESSGAEIQIFAQQVSAWHAQSPQILQRSGLTKCLFVAFDDARLPVHRAAVVQWPAADGRQVEAFCRSPYPADDPQTFFHLAHYLHQTIMQDSTAVLALIHRDRRAAGSYDDWLALSGLAPVLGRWTTLSHFLRDAAVGEYASVAAADDFAIDHLDRLVTGQSLRPVSGFARHWRQRRRIDSAWTWSALVRSLGGNHDADLANRLTQFEDRLECGDEMSLEEMAVIEQAAAAPLVERLLCRAGGNSPGLMLLNPCGFARRVAVERDDFPIVPATEGSIRAAQRDGDGPARLVIDVPALGFTWIPRPSEPNSQPAASRRPLKLADPHVVRNEYFEAEVDPQTGGLRAFRDLRTRENRVGQQLVFQPGSEMRAQSVTVTARGPAMGEIISEGALLDEHKAVLATFRQHFRAWQGRPVLELRIELFPEPGPEGYPWHAYFGARFAWRDERATLLRGNSGFGSVTTHARPVSPEYLELRSGRLRTQLLPQGLPFHQRHAGRMLDVILIPPGETARSFSLALAIDRDHPAQTAWGLISPIVVVPVERGPPHIGPTGWLMHLDAPNLLLSSLRAGHPRERVDDRPAVIARLLEVSGFAGAATLRCARNPSAAELLEPDGTTMMPLTVEGDAVHFDFAAHDLLEMRVAF